MCNPRSHRHGKAVDQAQTPWGRLQNTLALDLGNWSVLTLPELRQVLGCMPLAALPVSKVLMFWHFSFALEICNGSI